MTIKWNMQQKALFAELESGRSDIVVEADAGTGKSTTEAEAVRRLVQHCGKKNILCAAFNTSTKIEKAGKLKAHGLSWKQANSKSLNGMGNKLVLDNIKGTTLVQRRTRKVARRVVCKDLGQNYEHLFDQQWSGLPAKALEMRRHIAQIADVVDQLAARAKARLTPWTDRRALERLAIDSRIFSGVVELDMLAAYASMTLSTCLEELTEYDYDDQIWLPHALNLEPNWKHMFVFIDEAQDLNPAQIELAEKHVARKYRGRLVATGDSNQAIYGWRGADSDILKRMAEESSVTKLRFNQSYRCDEKIAEQCRTWVPDFESATGKAGEVECRGDSAYELAEVGDFVLARKNAPLVPGALKFIRRGIPAKVAGKGLIEGLEALIDNSNAETTDDLLKWVAKWEESEKKAHLDREDDEGAETVGDKAEVIRALALDAKSVSDVSTLLEETFTRGDEKDVVLFSTIHRAKGMERDTVFILGDTFDRMGDEEDNIRYVAASRAKHKLVYCGRPLTEDPPAE